MAGTVSSVCTASHFLLSESVLTEPGSQILFSGNVEFEIIPYFTPLLYLSSLFKIFSLSCVDRIRLFSSVVHALFQPDVV